MRKSAQDIICQWRMDTSRDENIWLNMSTKIDKNESQVTHIVFKEPLIDRDFYNFNSHRNQERVINLRLFAKFILSTIPAHALYIRRNIHRHVADDIEIIHMIASGTDIWN
jgi:hypothetical protein